MSSIVETIFTSRAIGYGIEATPCQRAWCRVLDGVALEELWADPDVQLMCGGVKPREIVPREFVGVAAIRTGKSLIDASTAIARARKLDLSRFSRREEPPHLPITSVRVKNAKAIFGHIKRLLTTTKKLRKWIHGKPGKTSLEIINESSGIPIVVEIVAGQTAASNLASFWHVAAIVDECFVIRGDTEDAAVSLDDVRRALEGRILRGGQVLYTGSPWSAEGPAYAMVERNWARADAEVSILRARGPCMNPELWSAEYCEMLRVSTEQTSRDAYTMGVLCEFLSSACGLLSDAQIEASSRPVGDNAAQVEHTYFAACDPATRRNVWTLLVGHHEGPVLVVDLAREWIPEAGHPLDSGQVIDAMARSVRAYRVTSVATDGYASDPLRSQAAEHGLELAPIHWRAEAKQRAVTTLLDGLRAGGRYRLPIDATFRADLHSIVRRVTQSGPRWELRESPSGRHGDYVSALILLELVASGGAEISEVDFPRGWLRGEDPPDPGSYGDTRSGSWGYDPFEAA